MNWSENDNNNYWQIGQNGSTIDEWRLAQIISSLIAIEEHFDDYDSIAIITGL